MSDNSLSKLRARTAVAHGILSKALSIGFQTARIGEVDDLRMPKFRQYGSQMVQLVTQQHFLSLVSVFSFVLPAACAQREGPDFNRLVRPILSARCFACHGPDETHREADLRLDRAESLLAPRDGTPAVVPGEPGKSELIRRILSRNPDETMPPPRAGKALTERERQILTDWVSSGAEVATHWAYVPPRQTEPPAVGLRQWPRNYIDHFVLGRLEQEGLQPSPDADPVTLVRRLHFDLTGLPPDPETVRQFLADPSDTVWAALVDRLLASDACAEHLTSYWLDLVRFADTVGYHGDQDHSISPYRDWVIDAFAENMAFDQFTREQLAGDLLPENTTDQKIASGYNRLLQTSHEGGVQAKEYLAIYAADRVRNLSVVWMGATVGCAQCHDHKYDPYTTRDFYSLAAYFADLDEDQHFRVGSNGLPTRRPPEIKVHTKRERARIAELKQLLNELREAKTPEAAERSRAVNAELEQLTKSARITMISVAKKPREMRILPRGNWLDASGPIVSPAVPQFLGTAATSANGRSTRLDLANWLCNTDEGAGLLTARVFANRFWYLMFGRGLSTSLDDFGGQGAPPEHPELLDQLAIEFSQNWNVKGLLRTMLNSRTYRQSSTSTPALRERDPENSLYARQSAFRLSAEVIRDSALEVSGLLVRKVGGASVKPYQPAGYYRHLNFPVRKYAHHNDDRQWRRGLYVHWQRQFLHPMLKAFDAPSREECTAKRTRSNTPLAALTLLNDPTFTEASRAFAVRILSSNAKSEQDRLRFAMQLAVSRFPDSEELKIFHELIEASSYYYRQKPTEAEKLLANGISAKDESLDVIEQAIWTTVARAILNLDETITRN